MPATALSALPHVPALHPATTTIHGREGVFVRCEGCHSLMRFLIVTPDGRQICRRCQREGF